MEFPLRKNPKKLVEFMEVIQKEQVPTVKVNTSFVKMHNFTSSYDEAIPRILRQLDFIDAAGGPTQIWRDYRDRAQSKKVMAKALRKTYSELFDFFSHPEEKSDDELHSFFKRKTELDEKTIDQIIETFRVLSSLADFAEEEEEEGEEEEEKGGESPPENKGKKRKNEESHEQFSINLNIQLQLPDNPNPEAFDKLFESMRKHLFK